tara:strand:+ start:13540 stop:14367 length:828 start_codon:yes stop_codon:yes gene_type:complete
MFKYIIFIFLVGCSVVTDNDNDSYKVLAKVDDKVLLVDDIIYQKSMGDSSVIITNQINNWLKKQLLLKSAYQTEELKSIIDKKVQNYRDDLLLFEFEKLMFSANRNEEINSEEVEEYYRQNIEDFILPYNLVKALYVKVSSEAPDLNKFISNFRKYPNIDEEQLRSYCYQFAEKSFLEDSIWIKFDDIILGSPFPASTDKKTFLNSRNFYQIRDDQYVYLYKILDKKLIGDFSPIDFEIDIINTIILNKRKQDLFDKLRDSIFVNSTRGIDYEVY